MIEILDARPGTSVQDLGRTGYAAWGIAPSGAADRASLRLANRLVGNAEDAAVIEVLLGGLTIRADVGALIAVTGAPGRRAARPHARRSPRRPAMGAWPSPCP